jgi:ABC-type Fe3+/spermidine/putrescine transport system ATPase subunit
MNAGRIEQIGTQTDIYVHPQTPFVADFIGANNSLAATVVGIEGTGDPALGVIVADGLTLRCRGATAFAPGQAVLAYVRPENIDVLAESQDAEYDNVVEGIIDRVIFEGPTAQMRVDVDGRLIRVDIAGHKRLTVVQRHGRVRCGFNEVTLIPASTPTSAMPVPTRGCAACRRTSASSRCSSRSWRRARTASWTS